MNKNDELYDDEEIYVWHYLKNVVTGEERKDRRKLLTCDDAAVANWDNQMMKSNWRWVAL